ncbi:MAG: acetate kinase [Alphaproteobacteria bacterium]|nr:acetate kinase [Alphaproteobacteria bacterium]MCL2890060.1 acetate kinase [Alphaproteobacteria bacterium]
MSYVLALNCGSSSLKYQIFDSETRNVVVGGNVEKIGQEDSFITQKYPDGAKNRKDTAMKDHNEALNVVMFMLREASIDMNEIMAVGHRVVHGGDKFASSVEITDEVIRAIEELSVLAPLHNPANLVGIVVAKQLLPNAKQVAVFDTAFHQTMPDYAYRYPVPAAWYRELGVRRYGFHGTSHLYVSKRAAAMLGKPASDINVITLHIGSGASATAIRGGRSVDTTMGLTPLSGLTMSTRSGDIDPGIIFYVMERLGITPAQIQVHLNKQSGMLGLSECYIDHRDIEAAMAKHDDNCRLALDVETHNIKKYIGAYMAELGHVDAIVFTAGVGENDDIVRQMATVGLEELGIKLDAAKNAETFVFKGCGETVLSAPDSKIKVFMIPTNEELVIVEDTIAVANGTYNPNHLEMEYSFLK